jgi:hypothetical protein
MFPKTPGKDRKADKSSPVPVPKEAQLKSKQSKKRTQFMVVGGKYVEVRWGKTTCLCLVDY